MVEAWLTAWQALPLYAAFYLLHHFSSIGHSNFDPFGRLRGFAALNRLMRMHQLHHSHGNVNYTSFNPIWDRIFGTYRP